MMDGSTLSTLRFLLLMLPDGGGDADALLLLWACPGSLWTRFMWSRRFQWRGKPLPRTPRSQLS